MRNVLSFCVFTNQLHLAWVVEGQISEKMVDIGTEKLEAVLFRALEERAPLNRHPREGEDPYSSETAQWIPAYGGMTHSNDFNSIIIPAGPAPFTQLRILRSVQLGLATGYQCQSPMVSMFDVLFTAANLETGLCLLDTRRGDYFFQRREKGKVVEEGVTPSCNESDSAIISDNPTLSTITISTNLATCILTHDFLTVPQLIYGIDVKF